MTYNPAHHLSTCWLPITEPGDTGPLVSHYFGTPWMADGEPWPECDGLPLRLILQLRVDTLPAPIRALLGGVGLVQFFYPHDDASADTSQGGGGLLRLVQPGIMPAASATIETGGEPTGLRKPSRKEQKVLQNYAPKAITGWRAYQDGMNGCEELTDVTAEGEGGESCIQGDKLGGWPFWTQACDRMTRKADGSFVGTYGWEDDEDGEVREGAAEGEAMVPFYQMDAGCFYKGPCAPAYAPLLFAGDGTLHMSVLPSDPTVMTWRWACG